MHCPRKEACLRLPLRQHLRRKLSYFTSNHPSRRLLENILDFVYKGEVEVEQPALSPLAVLALRLGLAELVQKQSSAGAFLFSIHGVKFMING